MGTVDTLGSPYTYDERAVVVPGPWNCFSQIVNMQYSHKTVIVVLASADPSLFCTLHSNIAPLSPLIRPVTFRISVVERTVLLPCLVHVIFGRG